MLLSNHSRDLHTRVRASLLGSWPFELQASAGGDLRRKLALRAGHWVGSPRLAAAGAPPVAVFEHSTEKAAPGTDFCSQPHWAGQGHSRRGTKDHPEPVPQSRCVWGGETRTRRWLQRPWQVGVPGWALQRFSGEPGCRLACCSLEHSAQGHGLRRNYRTEAAIKTKWKRWKSSGSWP